MKEYLFGGKKSPPEIILERYFIGLFINENLTKLEKKVGTEKIDVILFLFISLSVMKGSDGLLKIYIGTLKKRPENKSNIEISNEN